MPWHEDSAYWAGMLEPMENVLSVWLALDPSVPDNGCVRFVPGSHLTLDGTYVPVRNRADAVFASELAAEAAARAERDAVNAVLQPGFCSIHHAKTIHGSNPNRSTQRRCGLTLRYFSASCRFLHNTARDPHFAIYLVRGQDRAGNRYGAPGVINQGWLDRLLAEAG